MANMSELLRYLVEQNGSDLHICAGRKPHIRIHGELHETEFEKLMPEQVRALIYTILKKEQIQILEKKRELDFAYMVSDLGRFRINVYMQRGSYAVVLRAVPFDIKSFEELGIPQTVKEFIDRLQGLILITGHQGTGKTTTLASIIDYINTTRRAHIITVEDPIEYLHRSKKSIINQREIGTDTFSYTEAMRYILRQDPDVCLIGEMRDTESVMAALRLAEAGILVLSTLHSPAAPKAVSRIIDMFTPDYQHQIRVQLSLTLVGVISQELIPARDSKGRVLACEIMKVTTAIENMIRSYSIKQIPSVMQTGKSENMWTMDQYLFDLYTYGKISKYELCRRAQEPLQVEKWLKELD